MYCFFYMYQVKACILVAFYFSFLTEADPFYHDNYSLVILLKGACLKCKGKFLQAEQCFKEVLERYGDAQLQYRKENLSYILQIQENA